jgi:hypothetical protein
MFSSVCVIDGGLDMMGDFKMMDGCDLLNV